MKKLFLAFALVACFAVSALSQGAPPWTIQEVDGSPRVNSPTLIKVTNGTLSCTGKTCTITISGGGGGSPGGSNTQVQYNAAGSFGGISGFTSDGTNVTAGSGNLRATRPRFITSIDDTNGNEVFIITATGSAVNEVTIANAATGNNPTFTASGGDANVGINFVPKGSGTIQVSGAAIVTVSATQTLTNKTLTTPIIAQISNTGTLTLPTSTDTLVGRATTDTLTNKTLSTSNTVSAALTWTAGVKQTFAPDATTAGINVGSVAGNPSAPSNADLWYNTATNELYARINGANVALGSGGGSGANPTASVGLSAVNGVATTFMRSDAAPPLDQAITPTWTGQHIWSLSNAAAVAIGPNGNTNPVFRVVTNVASAATGVSITGNAAGAGAVVAITSPNATENLTIQAKGSGAAVILGTTAGAQVVHFGSTAGSSIYSTTASGGDINFRSANSTFTFQGASGATFPSSSGWIELNGAARLFGPSAGVLRLGANGSTTAAGKLLVAPSTVTALGDITIGNATNPELSFSDTAETGGIRFNSTSNVLEWSNDRSTWNAFSSGGGGITIGTTTITSGTNTRVLYNNSGVVGEYTVTGTAGSVVLSTSPTITTPAITTSATITRDAIGSTSTDGLILTNTTAAAAGAQQYSPRIRLTGQGWKTTATAASQTVDWEIENIPVEGTTNPSTNLVISSQVNGGGYTARLTLTSGGQLILASGSSSAPAVRLGSQYGFYNNGGAWNRTNAFFGIDTNSLGLVSGTTIQWNSSSDPTAGGDTGLGRAAAGILEVNNGTNGTRRWFTYAGAKRATSDTTASATTTLADVTGTPTALLSGRTYGFRFYGDVDSDATGGQKFAIAYGGTTSQIQYNITYSCEASGLNVITSRQTTSAGAAGQAGCTAGHVIIEGSLTTTSASNLSVQFAQNAASGSSTVRANGSSFLIFDLP